MMHDLLSNTSPTDSVAYEDTVFDAIDETDMTYLNIILWSYIESYLNGDLAFKTTISCSWYFLEDYEHKTEDDIAFSYYKSALYFQLIEHLVTSKPKIATKFRTPNGTPPPQFRAIIPLLVNKIIEENPDAKTLPAENNSDFDQVGVPVSIFNLASEKLSSWGFPKTTASMIRDEFYKHRI